MGLTLPEVIIETLTIVQTVHEETGEVEVSLALGTGPEPEPGDEVSMAYAIGSVLLDFFESGGVMNILNERLAAEGQPTLMMKEPVEADTA